IGATAVLHDGLACRIGATAVLHDGLACRIEATAALRGELGLRIERTCKIKRVARSPMVVRWPDPPPSAQPSIYHRKVWRSCSMVHATVGVPGAPHRPAARIPRVAWTTQKNSVAHEG